MNAVNAEAMHIVLPFVDSPGFGAALPVALVVAKTLRAELRVVTDATRMPQVDDALRRANLPQEERDAIIVERATGDLADATLHAAGAARHAMVILATRFHGERAEEPAPDSDAFGHDILERITRPVLIVPPDRDMHAWQWRKQLLPQDGTPECAGALAQVINRSSHFGIENLVMRVAGADVGQPTEPGSLATPRYIDHPQYEWDIWGQEFLDRIQAMGVRIGEQKLTLLMASGDPGVETLRTAREKEADMIVLPWHCAIGSGRALLVKSILEGAECPVLLLPQRGSDRCRGAVG
ncbi:MAG TPA: universal stress protein [Noviherbaspirillum sp.]|uniref:universal stress protein n=1 Tax=Noviherbaspirillum sp. TaxID=1926288 RepID=UPI002B4A3F75|nr:universal stress protein [Noviherbaspirillum sp.]HJV88543.1 universal stress protein [Noviherbaspirillum sp.]